MQNKLYCFLRELDMVSAGDTVICAVSGGADSMALLWAMYLLKEKLDIRLSAAHFNHGLRGAESDRDEAFVRRFCEAYEIPLHCGAAQVVAGAKGLEAAARDARYAFFETLPGKIATAHTADDNAETVLMHLVRGTGLKGLGAIAPAGEKLIRPMLTVTRDEVLVFLEEYHIAYVEDSSNSTDAFLRNRLRHHVMPLLYRENPRLAENLSAMALDLREDEKTLATLLDSRETPSVEALRAMAPAQRRRALAAFLEYCGVKEPERAHIALAEDLVFSQKPSARADFPGGIVICRNYDRLTMYRSVEIMQPVALQCPGVTELPGWGLRIVCTPAETVLNQRDLFTICPQGTLVLRSRQTGDAITLSGGTKSVKKLFIDRKIPADRRGEIPVLADDLGVVGIYGIGPNIARIAPGIVIALEQLNPGEDKV